MPKLIEHVLKEALTILKSNHHLGDGSYDSNENFKYLQKKRIRPAIKVRKNSITSLKNNSLRNREVYSQLKDLLKWKKSKDIWKQRWMAETVFSSIKENLWRICVCNKISKYDKRDDIKSVIV